MEEKEGHWSWSISLLKCVCLYSNRLYEEISFPQIEDPYKHPQSLWRVCRFQQNNPSSFVFIQSFLGIFNLRQVVTRQGGGSLYFSLNATSVPDHDTSQKVIQITRNRQNESLLSGRCDENLCFNGGFCPAKLDKGADCVCKGHFIGPHCLQTACDAAPCLNGGVCHLTKDSFECICSDNFTGKLCDKQIHPCKQKDVCSNHGICIDDGPAKFRCQCHLWWTGKCCATYFICSTHGFTLMRMS